jgi:menaquinone-dependent protoporphyrinogen oxidase
MKTLILYATKHGAAREIAGRIAKRLDGAVIHDLKQGGVPSLAGYDCVIVGSSLYAGMLRKEAKTFLQQNVSDLRGKRLGLFVSGMDASQEKQFLAASFPAELLQAASSAAFLGGIFDPKKAGVMGRMIMKAVAKRAEYTDTIDDAKIQAFTEGLLR